MKILLQDTLSRQYLTPYGGWTALPGEAANFVTPPRAWRAAKTDSTMDLTVVIHFPFMSRVASKFKRGNGLVASGGK